VSRKIKKTVYTVNIDNYQPEVWAITSPLMKHYAEKIGANLHVIDSRKFPEFPGRYEKLQIYTLAREHQNDWNIYFDSDALIHPDMIDMTTYLNKGTVIHNGRDVIGNRYREDCYTMRAGVNFSSCNWFAIASDWCLDLWHPLEDMTIEEACANIFPTVQETLQGVKPIDLIDDYVLTRNIARYGLKFTTAIEILREKCGYETNFMMHHLYAISADEKVKSLKQCLTNWALT
jgi:hypothetical protein